MEARLSSFPTTDTYTVQGAKSGRHFGALGAGWTVVVNEISSLVLDYDVQLGHRLVEHTLSLSCLLRW